jgi:hypothetical protein
MGMASNFKLLDSKIFQSTPLLAQAEFVSKIGWARVANPKVLRLCIIAHFPGHNHDKINPVAGLFF